MIVDATRQASLQLSLRLRTMSEYALMNLALQAAYAINCLAANGHIHGDVSAHKISYQDGIATLIDLATLRPMDQVPVGLSLWRPVAHAPTVSNFCSVI